MTDSENTNRLAELIKHIKVAMMTTIDSEGCLYTRPMFSQELNEQGQIWFFSDISSGKVDSIRSDQNVSLAYASPSDSQYVSISGVAEVVRDQAKIKELWKPAYKAYFPKGLEDPNLTLIKVSIETAEYWDSPSGTVVTLISLAKAMLTGKTAVVGEHERINLKH